MKIISQENDYEVKDNKKQPRKRRMKKRMQANSQRQNSTSQALGSLAMIGDSVVWQTGIRVQVGKPLHVYEQANLTPSLPIANPVPEFHNSSGNRKMVQSSLSIVSSGCQQLLLRVETLGLQYDGLLDSGTSHNFVSKSLHDHFRVLWRSCGFQQVQTCTKNELEVVLTNGSSTKSMLRISLQVKLANGQLFHLECNIFGNLCQNLVLGMLFLRAFNP